MSELAHRDPWLNSTPGPREKAGYIAAAVFLSAYTVSNSLLIAVATLAVLVITLTVAQVARRKVQHRLTARAVEAKALMARADSGEAWREAQRWRDADDLELPLAEVVHRAMQRELGVDPDELDRQAAEAQREEEELALKQEVDRRLREIAERELAAVDELNSQAKGSLVGSIAEIHGVKQETVDLVDLYDNAVETGLYVLGQRQPVRVDRGYHANRNRFTKGRP